MKKILPQLFWVIVIDFFIILLWVKIINPTPSVSIYLIFLVPFVIGLNLVIAGVLYFVKKNLAKLFIINSIFSAILMVYLFDEEVGSYLNEKQQAWEFQIADTTFSISHWKESNSFSFLYSTDPDMSVGFLHGDYIISNKNILLRTDSTEYKIKTGFLYGFRKDSIKLRKVKY